MSKIPIVFSTNEEYAPYCTTTIASILSNAKENTELEFLILSTGLSQATKNKFEKLKKIKDCSMEFISVNKKDFMNCPISDHFSIETYFRFKLASFLPMHDKVIYLDSDMIVLKDLSELFETAIDNNYAAMVINSRTKNTPKEYQSRLDMPVGMPYFNAGLMLINLYQWRKNAIEKKLFEWTKLNTNKIRWVDQDVINVVLGGFIKEVPEIFNLQLTCYKDKETLASFAKIEELAIIHYCGPTKPWNEKEMFLSEYFWRYAEASAFYDQIRERFIFNYLEMQETEAEFVKNLIRKYKPIKLLEVGVAAGSCCAIMLKEVKHNLNSSVFGIDYRSLYYRNEKKKTGWVVEEVFPELKNKLRLYTGGLAALHLDQIGKDIDFCILDTRHVLPGELLDFLMVLPFLKNGAICVVHDTNLHNMFVQKGSIRVSKNADAN
ncbi:MAG: glycosyltransferase, partial [Weeksellaceae bacterium]|nr:glycosyltransferase [Weeksellaceae bacterium]